MATVARTKQDVDQMDKKERLWDSLNHAYGLQRESSDKQYDAAISQADRQMLSRGMQRSSYGAQVLGNLGNQKVKAQNDIWNNQIADYENRLAQQEQQDAEAERWEKQFNASREDAAWNKEFQQKQADTAANQWQLNFDASRQDAAWNKDFQQKQADTAANQWQATFNANRADTAWNQGFQEKQANLAADQWERTFAQGNDSADRQLAASYVSTIIANGGTPSDDLLARAGLSRADAEAMKKSGGSGNPGKNPPPAEDENHGDPDALLDDVDLGMSDDLKNRLSSVANFVASGLNSSKSTSRTALVDNNNGNPNRYQSSPYGTTPISPIDDAFNSEFSVTIREENPLKKSTNGAGGKIKSTTTKIK